MNMFRSFRKSIKKVLSAGLKLSLNNVKLPLEKPGSERGWLIPAEKLGAPSGCYPAGTGESISFDIALTKNFNCTTISVFRPAPGLKKHFNQVTEDSKTGRTFSVNNTSEFYDI